MAILWQHGFETSGEDYTYSTRSPGVESTEQAHTGTRSFRFYQATGYQESGTWLYNGAISASAKKYMTFWLYLRPDWVPSGDNIPICSTYVDGGNELGVCLTSTRRIAIYDNSVQAATSSTSTVSFSTWTRIDCRIDHTTSPWNDEILFNGETLSYTATGTTYNTQGTIQFLGPWNGTGGWYIDDAYVSDSNYAPDAISTLMYGKFNLNKGRLSNYSQK